MLIDIKSRAPTPTEVGVVNEIPTRKTINVSPLLSPSDANLPSWLRLPDRLISHRISIVPKEIPPEHNSTSFSNLCRKGAGAVYVRALGSRHGRLLPGVEGSQWEKRPPESHGIPTRWTLSHPWAIITSEFVFMDFGQSIQSPEKRLDLGRRKRRRV